MKTKLFLITFVLLSSMIIGCSSQNNPATPSQDVLSGQPLVGVSERFPDGSPASGMGALGIFNLSVNADEISAELTPIRQNSLTDVLEVVDITNFLRMAPCSDCAIIDSIFLDIDNNLVVSIGIKHPFPAGDPLKPISGKNRGDLHVFNVEGTIVSNVTGTSFPGLGKSVAGFTLVNADGYSPYLDTVLDDIYPTEATVHPYILHFDDYTAGNFDASNPMGFESVTDPPPSGNLVMAMGCDYDFQDYVLDVDGSFDFIYAVGCTYAVSSANKAQRFSPEYRSTMNRSSLLRNAEISASRGSSFSNSKANPERTVVRSQTNFFIPLTGGNIPSGSDGGGFILVMTTLSGSTKTIFVFCGRIKSPVVVLSNINASVLRTYLYNRGAGRVTINNPVELAGGVMIYVNTIDVVVSFRYEKGSTIG